MNTKTLDRRFDLRRVNHSGWVIATVRRPKDGNSVCTSREFPIQSTCLTPRRNSGHRLTSGSHGKFNQIDGVETIDAHACRALLHAVVADPALHRLSAIIYR